MTDNDLGRVVADELRRLADEVEDADDVRGAIDMDRDIERWFRGPLGTEVEFVDLGYDLTIDIQTPQTDMEIVVHSTAEYERTYDW